MGYISTVLLFFLGIFCTSLASPSVTETDPVDSLKLALSTGESPAGKINTLLSLSRAVEGHDLKEAMKYAQQAYNLARQDRVKIGELNALLRMGAISLTRNDYNAAMDYAEKANELSHDPGLVKENATARGIMAIIYAELGDYGRSMEINYTILRMFEQINNKMEIGITMGNIGADYLSQKNYKMAIEYLYKALNIARELGDKLGMAHQYNNISGIYLDHLKNYPKALQFLREALKVNSELGNKQLQGINYTNLGITYFRLKETDSALYYYTKGLTTFTESNSPLLIADCEIYLGEYYYHQNDREKSKEYASAALTKGQEYNSFETTLAAAKLLHEISLAEKDSANAYKFSMIQHHAQDSLLIRQNQKEIYKLDFQYNYERIDKARQIKQNRKNYMFGLIVFTLVAGIVIVLLINSRQRIKVKMTLLEKEKVESELYFKNKELTINLIALMKKNEMLADISNKLVMIEQEAKKEETREALSRISHEIQKNADDKMLKEFSIRFQEVHQGFYENLLKKFPDLTQSELKLCAFLRLNMTTKEISELTGQRLLTVEHARYRLRKKLGISNSEANLVTFLSQL
ncbi:MAG: tetratricopeptide repeat protein [Bacteroidales bacterium]|nr:tetratricopeptide repeat protein [Bacteroidales bacterium]